MHWERAPRLGADQGPQAEGQPRHWRAIPTGKAPIQAMGVLARVGHHDVIASQEVTLLCTLQLVTKAHPQQRGPRDHRGEQAVHGTITAPWAGPTGHASHRDASRQDPEGRSHPAALA